jgi:ribose-phosphate pyrophosphokinase
MIDTAGTITNAANALKEKGALEVDACCTHAVLSGPALERIEKSAIEELLVLNTIELPEEKLLSNIKVVSVADMFSSAINCIHTGESISKLFDV